MFRQVQILLLSLMMMSSSAIASAQTATPPSLCPNGWYPAIGALSLDQGEGEWFVCSPFETHRTVYGVSANVVLIQQAASDDQAIYALDPVDGSELWRRETRRMPVASGPADALDIVVLPVREGDEPALVGVDSKTGTERWRIQSNEVPIVNGAIATIIGSPVKFGEPSPVRALDRETGEELWSSDVVIADDSGASVGRSSATALDTIAVLPTGETISAIDLRTGDLLWQAPHLAHVVAADGVVVGIEGSDSPGAMVTALDIASGERLWTARGGASYGGLVALGDGVVVVLGASNQEHVAYELATGDERWRVGPVVRVEPQVISGTTVVALWEGEITAVSTVDGSTIWSVTVPFGTSFMNSVGANDDVIVVAMNSLPWSD